MSLHLTFQDDLKAYADGELPLLRRLAVRRHLTHCASCREEISHMTQIAEDLRAAETQEGLDPALRAKLLGIGEPTPARLSPPPLPKQEGEEQENQAYHTPPLRLPVSGGSLRSKEVGSRKRPALPWLLAGAAVLAWFGLFPLFQKGREADLSAVSAGSFQIASQPPIHDSQRFNKPMASNKPPTFTVRLSDREAGIDKNGKVPVSIVNGNNFSTSAGDLPSREPLSVAAPATSNTTVADVSLRQVHNEATIGVQVPNPEATGDTVAAMVKESGGFVAANTLNTGNDGLKSAELIVKVPVTQFESFLGQVAKLGNVQSKNISGEDITEKTSDADQTESVLEDDVQKSEARLKALGSKAKWHDEQATRDLRIQLAESRARLVLLKRMAALSTITIDLSQTPKPAAPTPVTNGFLDGLKGNTHDALQSLLSSASALLALVIWLLAYAPIWIPLLLVGRYGLREYRKRQELGT
jgi:hypothetical protein